MDKDIAIKVENVSKTFRIPHEKISTIRGAFVNIFRKNAFEEFKALDDVSFEIKKGEFFGIIGRNGSGKSTLLKILAGIYQADKGKIHINGRISPFLELGIGFNPELSGRDNVYLNATVLGLTRKQIDQKFDDIVAFSELERFIDQKLKNYSSGMQVRLAFSVAIHVNRDILLMDEVLAVGDSSFQAKCLEVFRKFKEGGKTIVLVTHSADIVREFCDRSMLLNDGKLVSVGGAEKSIFDYGQVQLLRYKYGLTKTEYQNLTDATRGVGKANRYVKIETLDGGGRSTPVFFSGDDIIINIRIEANEPSKGMFVNVAICDKVTTRIVCGNSTNLEGKNIVWKKGVNNIGLIFKNNFFNEGEFYLISNLFEGNLRDGKVYDYYDSRDVNQYIKIIPNDRHRGIVRMPHEWKL